MMTPEQIIGTVGHLLHLKELQDRKWYERGLINRELDDIQAHIDLARSKLTDHVAETDKPIVVVMVNGPVILFPEIPRGVSKESFAKNVGVRVLERSDL